MMPIRLSIARIFSCLIAAWSLALLQVPPAVGKQIEVKADRVLQPGLDARDIRLQLTSPASANEPWPLNFQAAELLIPDTRFVWRDVRMQCEARSVDGIWQCEGPVSDLQSRTASQRGARLQIRYGATQLGLQLIHQQARLAVNVPRSESSKGIQFVGQHIPLNWMQPEVDSLVDDLVSSQGLAHFDLHFVNSKNAASRLSGTWKLSGLGFDTKTGTLAGAGLILDGQLDWRSATQDRVQLQIAHRAGEFLFAPLYLTSPAQATNLSLVLDRANSKANWQIPEFAWRDPGGLLVRGRVSQNTQGQWHEIALEEFSGAFPHAYDRYLKAMLGETSFADLETKGEFRGHLQWSDRSGLAFDFTAQPMSIRDRQQRFDSGPLQVQLHWNQGADVASTIEVPSSEIYGIASHIDKPIRFIAHREQSRLLEPVALSVLGGTIQVQHWKRLPMAGERAPWEASARLEQLDMARLATALDWPQFGGRLSGTLPRIHAEGEVYRLDGGLDLQLFDGRARFDSLTLERPFGVAPSLAGELSFEKIDLALLTKAFSFGSITGRMQGEIKDLRLVDWAPMQFDARFRTDDRGKEDKRISQNAVSDLSQVGGGSALTQTGVLKLFESFPYDELGLNCRLHNNVCVMGGLDSSAKGYTIVKGAGFPRLTITGFQQRVNWPVLMARLKAATAGQSPRVQTGESKKPTVSDGGNQ